MAGEDCTLRGKGKGGKLSVGVVVVSWWCRGSGVRGDTKITVKVVGGGWKKKENDGWRDSGGRRDMIGLWCSGGWRDGRGWRNRGGK